MNLTPTAPAVLALIGAGLICLGLALRAWLMP